MSKVWLVTGSSPGLGRAIVEVALAAGDRVAATARNPERLQDLVEKFGDAILPLRLDVTDDDAAEQVVASAVARFGRIDVAVNSAGYCDLSSFKDTTIDSFRGPGRHQLLRCRQLDQVGRAGYARARQRPPRPGRLAQRPLAGAGPDRLPGREVGRRRVLPRARPGDRPVRGAGHRARAGRHAHRLGRLVDDDPAAQPAVPAHDRSLRPTWSAPDQATRRQTPDVSPTSCATSPAGTTHPPAFCSASMRCRWRSRRHESSPPATRPGTRSARASPTPRPDRRRIQERRHRQPENSEHDRIRPGPPCAGVARTELLPDTGHGEQ